MSHYRGRRVFRQGRGWVLMYVIMTLVFVTGAVMTHRERGWTWVSVGLAGVVLLGLGAIVESLVLRIELTDDALVITDLRGRRRVSKTDIAGVAEAKGVPASLQLTGGRWMKLPLVGDNLGNSVRVWLKDTGTGAAATPP